MSIKGLLLVILCTSAAAFSQTPPIEPGVSQELAKWRSARYSDVSYRLSLTLEKMSPVLKGSIEIRVKVGESRSAGEKGTKAMSEPGAIATGSIPPIILDWRKIRGHEERSTISNVTINGRKAVLENHPVGEAPPPLLGKEGSLRYEERDDHLIFYDNVKEGENVITLDFTSPILTSGSAITRYIDKEDGSEYIYSLFVPSDASTAFPIFDQPDIKARFTLTIRQPLDWRENLSKQLDWVFLSNSVSKGSIENFNGPAGRSTYYLNEFEETQPISTYVFAFAAGPFDKVSDTTGGNPSSSEGVNNVETVKNTLPTGRVSASEPTQTSIYIRKSQAEKFKPHAAEVFRLNRESIKFFEEYFDYKFPFSKYDLVLIPEFPFGGMEHAGATFLRESSIIFPQEPTQNDHISRALLIFHEAAHQWFGDTVTMKWFDDLWLKEGFANFAAYKALEKIMPEANAWKVFYERVKQAAYRTDSTKGTTPIYQEIKNLSAAKSAYGNIVYNKAPAFLRQAEFYLGEDKFQTAVRAFLKKHEFKNATWEDLVKELENKSQRDLAKWADVWVKRRGLPLIRTTVNNEVFLSSPSGTYRMIIAMKQSDILNAGTYWDQRFLTVSFGNVGGGDGERFYIHPSVFDSTPESPKSKTKRQDPLDARIFWAGNISAGPTRYPGIPRRPKFVIPNQGDFGYGIFLLDKESQKYFLKNIAIVDEPFIRSMIWGALWDSVREGELDPNEYVELVVNVLRKPDRQEGRNAQNSGHDVADGRASALEDESTTALLLSRVSTAMNYYIDAKGGNPNGSEGVKNAERGVRNEESKNTLPTGRVSALEEMLRSRVEDLLIERMQNAETQGQRITYYRAFLNVAESENARNTLKAMLKKSEPPASAGGFLNGNDNKNPPTHAGGSDLPLKTKDKFDIVTRLIILGDPEGEKLLAELEKTETSDDAKRWAYAARAGIATPENKAKYWKDFTENKDISESWIEAAFGPWNSIRHSALTLPYLERALKELPNHKANRKIFFVNGWLGAFIGGQRSEEALNIINEFLADHPGLDNDLRLKILENADTIERAVNIRAKHK
ncbi:MAG: hypothetical protein KF685_09305 [Acidobacteria bacterium]|nr:hypothetical protein [Acidobacteriota bacterium]